MVKAGLMDPVIDAGRVVVLAGPQEQVLNVNEGPPERVGLRTLMFTMEIFDMSLQKQTILKLI